MHNRQLQCSIRRQLTHSALAVSLLQRGIRFISGATPKELVWKEKAPVSVARQTRDAAAEIA